MATNDSERIDGILASLGKFVRRDDYRDDMAALERRLTKHIDGVAVKCEDFRDEYRTDRQRALEGSVSKRMIVLAMIAGSATVLASIIGAAAVIITSSPS